MASFISALLPAVAIWFCAVGPPKPAEEPEGSYVEIDFSPLPSPVNRNYSVTVTIITPDKDFHYSSEAKISGSEADGVCRLYAKHMEFNRWRAKVVDNTKLRVYGRNFNDKLIPAIEGKVTSPNLKKEEMPKVKNPPKA